MRILILSNRFSGLKFFNLFSQDKDNIVFSLIEGCNKVDLQTNEDIIDFVEGNVIDFILVGDEKYIDDDLFENLNEYNLDIFSPCQDAVEISKSKSFAKKFMYKNKILTPNFQIYDKIQVALDSVKNLSSPVAIKPDVHNFKQRTVFCETQTQCERAIKNLFQNDCSKIIIEDYIEGKNITIWTLSDGFKAQILGTCAKYQDVVSYFEPEFVDENIKNDAIENYINPTISRLSYVSDEYIGILGFDFILDRENKLNLTGYKSFFDDIDVDFFIQGFNVNWLDIFKDTIKGDVFLNNEIKPKNEYMLSLRGDEKIEFIEAKTLSNLELYLKELNFDDNEYKEAKRIWKQ